MTPRDNDPATPVSLEPAVLRSVFGAFPTGVTAVAARVDGQPVGMAASSFTAVSLVPPLVSVCVGAESATWPTLAGAHRVGISVLAEEQGELCRQLSRRGVDRFAGVAWHDSPDGAVFVRGAAAWLECTLYDQLPAGDHHIVLFEVHRLGADAAVTPLVFHGSRFRRLHAAS